MQITLSLKKTIEQSANDYFEKSKKLRRKVDGCKEIIAKFQAQLATLEKKQKLEEERVSVEKPKRTLDWYEKFRWFRTSEGLLCIGGRDATTNEVVIKKHTDPNDVVFHTEMSGSPFFVLKTEGKTPNEASLQEAADATATFSRAWKLDLPSAEVFSVNPSQVSKQAPSGEYMSKGSFMITGKRTNHRATVNCATGSLDGKIMSGPVSAISANCKDYFVIKQGKGKPSDCAKKIAKKLGADVDDVLRTLPAGGCEIEARP